MDFEEETKNRAVKKRGFEDAQTNACAGRRQLASFSALVRARKWRPISAEVTYEYVVFSIEYNDYRVIIFVCTINV